MASLAPARSTAWPWRRIVRGERSRTHWAALLVMGFAAFLLFDGLGAIKAPIWDEAYYLPSTARYHEGRVQFATHPPLGLMLIAAGDGLYSGNAGIDQRPVAAVKSIHAEAMPPGYDYLGPRLASAVFGVIGAGLFFLLMRRLTASDGAALMLSSLYLLDTALLAQFRAAHLDAFQISFVLAALLCLVRGLHAPRVCWTAGFGVFVACAALVRANALILAPMGIFLLWPLVRTGFWKRGGGHMAAGIAAAALALGLVATINAGVSPRLPDPGTEAGRKDLVFVTASMRTAGRVNASDPVAVVTLIGSYARFMTADHEGMARHDANGSHPWQWPLGQGAITYRWDADDGHVATIALLPNLAAWLLSLLGVLWTLWSVRRGLTALQAALLTAWLLNMAALMWLDAQRVLYLYSYFLPLLIGHALLALAWRERGLPERPAIVALGAVTLSFLVAAPLALHREVPTFYCQAMLHDCGK